MKRLAIIEREEVIKLIQRTTFLNNLTYPELCKFVDLKTFVFAFEQDETIIDDGDYDMSLFVLLSGELGVYKRGTLVSSIEAGDCFGEISFITGKPRSADVVARRPAIAIRINPGAYDRLPPGIREKIKDSIILKLVNRIEQVTSNYVADNQTDQAINQ